MTGSPGLRVEVLGPLRARDLGGVDVTPSGVLQRRLLALFVLHRGRTVSTDAAVEALWPTAAPADPLGALQNHVSRLRAILPAGALGSVGDGYRLEPDLIEVDCDVLAALVRDPAAHDDAAVAAIRRLLDRWRGPAFVELDDVDEGRAEAGRLAELRVRAVELCAEHRISSGNVDDVVAELAALTEAEPLRERPHALLMTALATGGRTADALRVYDDFRRRIGAELGIEPSPLLVAQHAALLGAFDAVDGRLPTRPAAGLPMPVTPLIGRDELVDEIVALAGTSRLVTLVGPGGVGKTRVLLDVGHRLARDDVVLCELANVDVDAVEGAVAAALGVDPRADIAVVEQLAVVVGATRLVLLVDNCEHVIEPIATLVERLLARCPHLQVLATSRERLRVPGEHVTAVPVLAVDGDDAPAVRLFVDRARAAAGGFAPGPGELTTIREVVRRLDGLPLAIELAAARLFTHDLDEVAAGLDRRFALLASGHRTSVRHRSLGAAVSWSFDVLDPPLQEIFAALSVFVSPFTAASAAVVADVDEPAMRTALGELCDRSLVGRAPDRRYALLETLRAFGAEQLAATGRADVVADRHAHLFLARAIDADRRLPMSGERVIPEIEAALPELHAALAWWLDAGDAELAGRLYGALIDYGLLRLRPDVLAWAERITAIDPDDTATHAAVVWAGAAYAAWMAGDLTMTGERSARAVAVAERTGRGMGEAATIRGNAELFDGRLDEAVRWYRRAMAAAAEAGDQPQWLIAAATELLAMGYSADPDTDEHAARLLAVVGDDVAPHVAHAWYCAGESDLTADPDRAATRLARAIELAELTDAGLVAGIAGATKASLEARVGDPLQAAADFRVLIDHWRRAGMWSTQWTMLRSIAALMERLGRDRDAAVLLGAIRATGSGHRVFGADEVALRELGERLAQRLGPDEFAAAHGEGARLDDDAAVEHARLAL